MPLLLGPLLAPYIGGLLVSNLSWRFIFYINVPFALFMLFATLRFVDNYTQSTQPFNWPSFISLALFLAVMAYWLDTTLEITSFTSQFPYHHSYDAHFCYLPDYRIQIDSSDYSFSFV